jgi:hypothetical protein
MAMRNGKPGYLREMIQALANVAKAEGFETLEYILRMAEVEAEDLEKAETPPTSACK